MRRLFLLSLLACAFAVPALAEESPASTPHSAHDAMMAAKDAAKPKVNVYEPAMAKMHKDMMVKPTGNADVDFVKGMIPHHQGAIDMARTLKKNGKDPELQKLADDIIAAQEKEIAFMKDWLKKNSQ